MLASILARPIEITVPYPPNAGQQQFISKAINVWEVAAHWLIKLAWDSTYKLPFKQPLTRATREHGLHLKAMHRLAEVCHSRQGAVLGDRALPYANASEWFAEVYREILKANLIEVYHSEPISKASRQKKKAYLRSLRDLRDDVEKHEASIDPKVMPAFWLLLTTASTLARESDRFRQEFFNPFLASWSAMHSKMDTPAFKRHWLEGDKLYVQPGKTRAKKCLSI